MRDADDEKMVAGVVADLKPKFPDVPHVVIEQFVEAQYRLYEGAPIRDYIPVMARRGARESLAQLIQESRNRYGR
jgi:hypothetical protein